MLFNVLRGAGTLSEKLLQILILVLCVFFSLSVHEMSHGLGAYAMGDKTAKNTGRLSLNPFHHLDPFGALCLFLFGFGWAKPVMVNPWNFKHKKAGMIVTSLAGPVSNFILAFIALLIFTVLGKIPFSSSITFGYNFVTICSIICINLVYLNIGLGVFNLIPIPPLDGSKVLNAVLPQRIYFKIMEYERYGFIVLVLLLYTGVLDGVLNAVNTGIINFYSTIIGLFL